LEGDEAEVEKGNKGKKKANNTFYAVQMQPEGEINLIELFVIHDGTLRGWSQCGKYCPLRNWI
jgi:hypothetical protein